MSVRSVWPSRRRQCAVRPSHLKVGHELLSWPNAAPYSDPLGANDTWSPKSLSRSWKSAPRLINCHASHANRSRLRRRLAKGRFSDRSHRDRSSVVLYTKLELRKNGLCQCSSKQDKSMALPILRLRSSCFCAQKLARDDLLHYRSPTSARATGAGVYDVCGMQLFFESTEPDGHLLRFSVPSLTRTRHG